MQLVGFRNRLVVLINWAWEYFRFERAARLIYHYRKHSLRWGQPPHPPGKRYPQRPLQPLTTLTRAPCWRYRSRSSTTSGSACAGTLSVAT